MTRLVRWVVAAGLLLCGSPSVLAAQGGDTEAVKALELKRFEAMQQNDFSALEGLLADDMIYTHSSGQADTKAQFLEALRTGKTRYVKIAPTDTNVTIFGDTAVIRGRGQFTVENQAGKNEFTLSYLDVWLKRGGKWQMVAWQSARLPPPTQ
jgi:ketosteroid isomerase-like protein